MPLSIAPLLIHSAATPEAARVALRAAFARPSSERQPFLATAASALYRELGLDCDDARELVGLPPSENPCGCD
jgi:hypothetical protein